MLVHEELKNEDPTQEKLVVEDDFKEKSYKVVEQPFERMMDDSDESYDRPMSPGLRSRSPPHRAMLKMPNEDKVYGLCVLQAAEAHKDFGKLTRNVKLTTHEAAAKQKIVFREERKTTLQAAATRRYVKNEDFKTGRCKAGRPPDCKVGPREAKKSLRRREPQEVKKTPKALQKAVRRARRCEYEKVYKDLKGKLKKTKKFRQEIQRGPSMWSTTLNARGWYYFDEDMYTLCASESTIEIYDNIFCKDANLRDTIF